ncbi:unnamed protein product [Dicrocoelium dendriticum]|nr:unnamed protein product [Dicrocoelium dendriticum]
MTKETQSAVMSTPSAEHRRHSLKHNLIFEGTAKTPKARDDETPKLSSSVKKDAGKLKRPRQEDQQSPLQSPEFPNTPSTKLKKSRTQEVASSPSMENGRHSLSLSSLAEGAAKAQKLAGDGTPNSTKKGVSKLKRPREEDKQSPIHSLQSLNSEPMKPKKSREERGSVTENATFMDDPQQKVQLLGMIRQRIASLNARTLFVRKLPRSTMASHLRSLCPTSVNARLHRKTSDKRRKIAFLVFKTEKATREAQQSVNGKLISDRPIVAQLCSERASHNTTDVSTNTKSWPRPDQLQLQRFNLRRLHISCIPRSATQDEIKQLFPKSVSLRFDESGGKFAPYACEAKFASKVDAFESFISQHGSLLRGCPIIVNYAFKPGKPKLHTPSDSAKQSNRSFRANRPNVGIAVKRDGSPTHDQQQDTAAPSPDKMSADVENNFDENRLKLEEPAKNFKLAKKTSVKPEHASSIGSEVGRNTPGKINKLKKAKAHHKTLKINKIRLL